MNIKELLSSLKEYDDIFPDIDNQIKSLDVALLEQEVKSIEHDSRKVKDGSIFIAIAGTDFDSHTKIEQARNNGAVFVIGSKTYVQQPDLVLPDSRACIGVLSSRFNGDISRDMSIVGITGTNGKTTVSYLYSSMAKSNSKSCFTMGTTGIFVNGEKETDSQTTPDPLLVNNYFNDFYNRGVTTGAIEVSSHALDQYRVLGTKFKAVAFTNFSQDHLDYHTSMEEYFDAKAKLFSQNYSTKAVVNIDNDKSQQIIDVAKKNNLEIIRVSTKDKSADVYVNAKELSLRGSEIIVNVEKELYSASTDLIGDFNLENIAVAIGLAFATGYDIQKSLEALEHPDIVPGRLQRIQTQKNISVFVDYAHTPDALERVINVVEPLAKKTIVVFGCGGDRDRAKRPIMGEIARKLADIAIVTSDNPRSENPQEIIKEIIDDHDNDFVIKEDRKQAIRYALSVAQEGDAVIIAGKGHEEGQIFKDHTENFSDVKVAEEILGELNGI